MKKLISIALMLPALAAAEKNVPDFLCAEGSIILSQNFIMMQDHWEWARGFVTTSFDYVYAAGENDDLQIRIDATKPNEDLHEARLYNFKGTDGGRKSPDKIFYCKKINLDDV